ncbi:hypothetical protein FGO68_gene3469 [Halteria grandinella]|uniref:Uncharacterized protein n=1 Tax=Halteria grandinella TaxID=5974 RepID=A0A8J8NPD3_HALGN|nr:hypothetical protein FGO68_gene3469 [Halteria grandinella]
MMPCDVCSAYIYRYKMQWDQKQACQVLETEGGLTSACRPSISPNLIGIIINTFQEEVSNALLRLWGQYRVKEQVH